MEVIEKETIKEVPVNYYHDKYNCGYNRYDNAPYASKGVAGTGLGLGIAGTALGLLALSRNGMGIGLFGNSGMPENVNINTTSLSSGNGVSSPTAFQTWHKECDDVLALTNAVWGLKVSTMDNAKDAREIDVNEKFQLWKSQVDADFNLYKSQVDADFGLYKSTRDGIDLLNTKITDSTFGLYKSQRDNFDALSARIGALETKQAVADAVEPWRAKVLDMRINGVAANAQAGIALEAERRCCADNKIVNYVNGNFYPVSIADVTTGTATTQRALSNPLCGCCGPCNYNN